MSNSLRGQGFTDIVMLGDSGGNLNGMKEVASTLNAEWKGQGAVHFIPEYYNYGDVEQFQEKVLGIHEKLEGYHDDYYISAIKFSIRFIYYEIVSIFVGRAHCFSGNSERLKYEGTNW